MKKVLLCLALLTSLSSASIAACTGLHKDVFQKRYEDNVELADREVVSLSREELEAGVEVFNKKYNSNAFLKPDVVGSKVYSFPKTDVHFVISFDENGNTCGQATPNKVVLEMLYPKFRGKAL